MPKLNRRGFTLADTIVSITLIAVLAAVVVPTIAGQVKKGDPSRVVSDLVAIRGASEQFLSDVRKYPKSIGQLTNIITTGAVGAPLVGTNYAQSEVNRWRGPYLTKDSISADTTGYGVAIQQPFSNLSFNASGATPASSGGQAFMTARLFGIDTTQAILIDQMFDDGFTATGSIRWSKGTSPAPDTLKFLILPIH